jgi:hypothetical protein
MKLSDVSDKEIAELREQYRDELRRETLASPSVRRMWQIVVLALDDILARRFNGGARTVLDAAKMTRPGDEPLA